ncbi:SMC-Scp complex subunit ScpB [Candidatus Desantisbacteria bacterium CG_4_10_14_0_8_um_filter_48_22]|uniref:SMC-Scp complex subunit ScpB n=1 Tax=Candidatus Desantisbacteria bacterium CG_4_10_14_0_8_um_filter_48_22 TaxID=1974543 RepID=A0A2M7S538_9BACT|nr:MAG: SMC-Scp complex subunit ScpB [Candidatus Desantisbacteria bacterium CG02_land_8_20_14_3_00_49_13]PIZ14647.1 MAG: SMC-Scp complex subunit ScpB [Candidatus Desantisbacteria bacterium CG_4_10_14_0_8_um_filter_48_22]PJB27235.1 MAG: SMC-Scp complex subunit ScpB [Candidatus Desantisbacteria bacterium CG_4_9_14_3_um_filter_50_7]
MEENKTDDNITEDAQDQEKQTVPTPGVGMEKKEEAQAAESPQELPLKSVIESLLFVSDSPLTPERIGKLIGITPEEARKLASELIQEYDSRGHSFKIVEIAEGYQMCTRHEYAPWIKMLYASKNLAKLSKQSLETLAIIAYRQPITRAEIEALRGLDTSGVLHGLLEKKLVKIAGRKKVLGRPLLYRTTDEFLVYFGLKDLSDLPKVEELRGLL